MAYEKNWKPSDKASKEEIKAALAPLVPEITDNAFIITFASDGGGHHVVIASERDPNSEVTPYKNLSIIPLMFMGWRIIKLHAPDGYIKAFYNEDGSKSVVKSRDDEWG